MANPSRPTALLLLLIVAHLGCTISEEVVGCGGFIKSHADIDFSKVEVKLLTKQGAVKDISDCSATNGYYFLPVYDRGDYIVRISPPPGWSFEPAQFEIAYNGVDDRCTRNEDINFTFKGFGITGTVRLAAGATAAATAARSGARDVTVELRSADGDTAVRRTRTDAGGVFSFTPVIPGAYRIAVQREGWQFEAAERTVQVNTGNTELPRDAFVVRGYAVAGQFNVAGLAASAKVTVAVFAVKGAQYGGECAKTENTATIANTKQTKYSAKSGCVVDVQASGRFQLSGVPSGRYLLQPQVSQSTANVQLHIAPEYLEFEVLSDILELPTAFEVTGFTVAGRVLSTANGWGIAGAEIRLNGGAEVVATTHTDGSYQLRNIRAGTYQLQASAPDVQFNSQTVRVSLGDARLPDLVVAAYRVCGLVVSQQSYTVALTKQASTFHTQVASQAGTGEWCTYLPAGQFQVEVLTTAADREAGVQFFPRQEVIVVKDSPVSGVQFSQLRAKVSGEVRCLSDPDTACGEIEVTLLALDAQGKQTGQRRSTQVEATGGRYQFEGVLPGQYEVTVPDVYLCWASGKQRLNVRSAEEQVPAFVHNGYLVSVISSHATEMKLTLDTSAAPTTTATAQSVALVPGLNTICTKAFGTYNVRFIGCHSYDTNELPRTIRIADHAPITVNAIKHRTGIRVLADSAQAAAAFQLRVVGVARDQLVSLQADGAQPNADGLYSFRYDFDLKPEERVTLTPQSAVWLFQPASAELIGEHDCLPNALTFRAARGLIVDGHIVPAIAGATIRMSFPANADRTALETLSDAAGRFSFGPLDQHVAYEISARKESYVFAAYDAATQSFAAHKLCEIVATVRDESGAPLAGVLLSLSGGEKYRKNLVTGEDGTIRFHSLSPSQYYVRPAMKEYRFEPSSRVIDVADGQTVEVPLAGRRVAFSVLGAVRTLNGDPFGGAVVEAVATGEGCGQQQPAHREEATAEPNGLYRVRGLQPGCEYEVRVRQQQAAAAGDAAGAAAVERTIPAQRVVAVGREDVVDVNFVAIQPIAYVDVIARIEAASNEFYKTLRVQLYRKGASDAPIYSQRVEQPLNVKARINPGVMVFFPRIPADGRTYFVELTSSLSEKQYRYELPVQSFVANRSSVFVEVRFAPEVRSLDGDLNQNSVSALLLIAVLAVAFFKQELAFDFFNFLWQRFVGAVEVALSKNGGGGGGGGRGLSQSKQQQRNDGVIDESEIEKLAQSINATRKKPTRKA